VLEPESLPTIPEDEIFNFLKSKREWIDGVCITGGEPLLQQDLIEFARKIKSLGFRVKLDNLDLCKTSSADPKIIKRTIELIKRSRIDYEFRTTVLPCFTKSDIKAICEFIGNAKRYCLQPFIPREKLVGTRFLNENPLSKETLKEFAAIAKPYFKEVLIR